MAASRSVRSLLRKRVVGPKISVPWSAPAAYLFSPGFRIPAALPYNSWPVSHSREFQTSAVASAKRGGSGHVRVGAKRRAPMARKAPIVVTESAASRLKELVGSKEGAIGVRLGVKTRGCNGQSYTMNYAFEDDKGSKFDEAVDVCEGVKVYIEPRALFTILGTTMDWKEDALSAEFVFENPNATAVCGCGESFTVGGDGNGASPTGSGGGGSDRDESTTSEKRSMQ